MHFAGFAEKGLDITKYSSVESWLASINLEIYAKNFSQNLFTSMERVAAIWDDELTSILDIEKIGHRYFLSNITRVFANTGVSRGQNCQNGVSKFSVGMDFFCRKRILLSLAGRDGISDRFGKVKVNF